MADVTTRKMNTVTDQIQQLTTVKVGGFSLETTLALLIVNENASARYPMLYVGEVEAVFASAMRVNGKGHWSYGAISGILRNLWKKKLLTKEKDGRYVMYGISNAGRKLLVAMYGDVMDKRPKKKAKVTK